MLLLLLTPFYVRVNLGLLFCVGRFLSGSRRASRSVNIRHLRARGGCKQNVDRDHLRRFPPRPAVSTDTRRAADVRATIHVRRVPRLVRSSSTPPASDRTHRTRRVPTSVRTRLGRAACPMSSRRHSTTGGHAATSPNVPEQRACFRITCMLILYIRNLFFWGGDYYRPCTRRSL